METTTQPKVGLFGKLKNALFGEKQPVQPQIQPQIQQPIQPTQPVQPQIDKRAVAMARAIRQQESSHNYQAVGDGGRSHGGYQISQKNYQTWAKEAGLDPSDMSPQTQDKVAYHQIKKLIDRGFTPAQVAAAWNAGEDDAVKGTWVNKVEYDSQGRELYNTPKYVQNVLNNLKQVSSQMNAYSGTPMSSIEAQKQARIAEGLPVSMQEDRVQPTLGGEIIRGALKTPARLATNLINAGQIISGQEETQPFSGGYLGEVKPIGTEGTLGQRVKESVGAGLELGSYAIPGGQAAAGVQALKAGNIAAKPLLSTVLREGGKGAIGGALGGSGMAMAEGGDTGDIVKQGALGGLLGGVLGAGISGIGIGASKLARGGKKLAGDAETIVKARSDELNKLDRYKDIQKVTLRAKEQGFDPKDVLAKTDILQDAVDDTGYINTLREGGAREQYYKEFVEPAETVVYDNLRKEGKKLPIGLVEKKLIQAVHDSGLKAGAKKRALNAVRDDIEGLRLDMDKDGYIPVSELHLAKVDKYGNINYMNPESKKADKAIAKGLKELVQDYTKSIDVQGINDELAKHYSTLKYIEKLNGKKVEGGKLGKYFAQTVGSIVGSHFGPIGSMAGAELGGALKGAQMAKTFAGATGTKIPQSKLVQEAIEKGKDTVIPLGPQSNKSGILNKSQANTITGTKKPINKVSNKKGLLSNKFSPKKK